MTVETTARQVGAYQLQSRLTGGADSEVWLAQDLQGRRVVFKVHSAEGEAPGDLHLVGLEHPGIRACLDAGRMPGDGRLFTVAEYVDGVPLGPGELGEAPEVAAAQLLAALAFVHDVGLLHRDIKDDNVLLEAHTGRPVMLDFGLACPPELVARRPVAGTPRALSPELFQGQAASVASDLWAVGLLLAESLLGRRLFHGADPEAMAAERSDFAGLTPQDHAAIGNAPLAALLDRLLAPDPRRRPPDARAALSSLPLDEGVLTALHQEDLEAGRRQALARVDARLQAWRGALIRGALWLEPFDAPDVTIPEALARVAVAAEAVPHAGESLAARLAMVRSGTRRGGLDDLVGLVTALADHEEVVFATGIGRARDEVRAEERRQVARRLEGHAAVDLFEDSAPGAEGALSALRAWLGPRPVLEDRVARSPPESQEELEAVLAELARCGAVRAGAEGISLDETALPEGWPAADARGTARLLGALEDRSLEALGVLSLSPWPLSSATCSQVLGADAAACLRRLGGRGLVNRRRSHPDDVFEPADGRLRRTVLSAHPVAASARVRLSAALDAGAEAPDEETSAAIGWVLGSEAPPETDPNELSERILRCAATLRRVGRLDLAISLLRRGLAGLGPAAPVERQMLLDLVDLLIRHSSWDEALTALEDANLRLPDDPAWSVREARVLLLRGRPKQAAQLLASMDPDGMDGADALLGLQVRASALQALGKLTEGLADVREALRRQGEGADKRTMTLLERAASIEKRLGRFDDAVRHFEACIAMARELGLEVLVGSPMYNLGGTIRERGERRRGLKLQEEAVRRIEAAGDLPNLTVALNGLGAGWLVLGNVDTARRYLSRALILARRLDDAVTQGMVLNNTGRALAAEGRLQEAETCFAEAMELRASRGDRQGQAAVALTRGLVRLARGDVDGASADLDTAGRMLEGSDAAEWKVAACLLRARLALARGDGPGALGAAREAEHEAKAASLLGSERLEALDLLSRAGGATLEDIDADAEEAGPWLADLLFTRATLRERDGRREEADSDFGRALAVLGDTPDGPVEARGLVLRVGVDLGRLEGALSARPLDYGLVGDLLARVTRDLDRARALSEVHDLEPLRADLESLGARFGSMRHEGDLAGIAAMAERARMLERLGEINKALNTERETQRLLDLIVDSAIDLTGAARGFIILFDGRAEEVRAARNISEHTIHHPEFEISHSVARRVVQEGKPLLSANAIDDPLLPNAASISALNLLSVLCVPLHSRSRVLGAIYLDHPRVVGRFGEQHLDATTALAEQAAIALENARLSEGLSQSNLELRESREEIERLNRALESRLEVREAELEEVRASLEASRAALGLRYDYSKIITRSPRMHKILDLLDRITDTDFPVVIDGESGTGKELIARAIHFNGPRSERDFLSVNCAAIPESLIESELFGSVRGAFTGADRDRKGLFEQAHRGSLFMDEIGDMSLGVQKRLLRVLQDGEFMPVGGREVRRVDVRVLCATHREMEALVRSGEFREDLYYRLAVAQIHLPPLRDRTEDVALLLDHFLRLHGGGPRILEPDAVAILQRLPWPGNVRQLENLVMNFLLAEPKGDRVTADMVRGVLASLGGAVSVPEVREPAPEAEDGAPTLRQRMAAFEREQVGRALEQAEGNKSRAAKTLGVPIRTFYKILDRLGL